MVQRGGLEEGFTDWLPDVFEEDFKEAMNGHLFHKRNYAMNKKGKIQKTCSCGEKKEIEVLLNVYVFEKMVFIKSVCLLGCKLRGTSRNGYGFQLNERRKKALAEVSRARCLVPKLNVEVSR